MRPISKISDKLFLSLLLISIGLSFIGYYRYFFLSSTKKQRIVKKISSRTRSTLDVEQKFYLFPIDLLSEFEETRYTIPIREQIKKKGEHVAEDICKNILEMRNQDIIRSELESFAN